MYSSFIYHYKPYLSWPLKATVRSKDDNTVLVTGGQGVTVYCGHSGTISSLL